MHRLVCVSVSRKTSTRAACLVFVLSSMELLAVKVTASRARALRRASELRVRSCAFVCVVSEPPDVVSEPRCRSCAFVLSIVKRLAVKVTDSGI